jgi:hypothetical protein
MLQTFHYRTIQYQYENLKLEQTMVESLIKQPGYSDLEFKHYF